MSLPFSLLVVLGLALIHVVANRLAFLAGLPRSIWLSIAGGVSVAYVFLHILPELQEGQEIIKDAIPWLYFLEHHVYLLALTGLVTFYGLERAVVASKEKNAEAGAETESNNIFWLHIASFSIYNAMLGAVLFNQEQQNLQSLIFFFIAIGLHFLVNDFSLQSHYSQIYIRIGRWVLAGSILVGWAIAFLWEVSEESLIVLLAFLAGGIVLNVLKEELPSERESKYWAFVAGAGIYSLLLLLL